MTQYPLVLKFADGALKIELAQPPRCPSALMALCLTGFQPTHHRESGGLLEWVQCASDGVFLGAQTVARELAHCLACVAPVVSPGQAATLPADS